MTDKCVLHIKDEVNVRFVGVDPSTRRKMKEQVEFFLPHAYHTPAYKLGRWDGKMSFCDVGGRTYFNVLEKILPVVVEAGYEIEIQDDRHPYQFDLPPINAQSFSHVYWPEKHPMEGQPIVIRDHQIEVINRFFENPQSLQQVATGAGKCQPYDSKVLTPDGWRTMGDIQAGDWVTVPDGSSAKVISVYEPGEKDVYEITFKDGRKVRCCDDHIWPVYNISWKKSKSGPVRNITTRQIREHLNNNKRPIGIQLPTFENDTNDIQLPMDPWLLGFLLGDGCMRNGGLGFSSADSQLVDRVSQLLNEEYQVKHKGGYDYHIMFANKELARQRHGENISRLQRNHLGHILENGTSANIYIQALKDMGVYGKLSHEKFIPEIYFRGSKHQRLELIRGLVDSDGTIDKKSIYFTSTSKKLSEGFAELVHSVGGIAKLTHSTDRTYMYKGKRTPCRDAYTVATKYATPWDLVSLSRKQALCGESYQYGPTLKNNIVSVEKVDREPVKCILIDHPDHLYITDGYTVTHNTLVTAVLSASVEKYGRSVVIVPNKDLVVQTAKDYHNMGLDYGVLFGDKKEYTKTHTICTWQSIASLLKDVKAGNRTEELASFLEDIVCVMVDEVHKAKADVLREQLSGIFANVPIRWGLTGTIPEAEHEAMACTCCLGPVVGGITSKELQDLGLLSDLDIHILQLQDGILGFTGYQQELKWLTTDLTRLRELSKMINEFAKEGNTLVLIDRIATGDILQDLNPDWVFLSGATKQTKRQEEYESINDSDNKVIVATYGIAAVGINIPRIFNLVMLEPGKSFVRVIQSIGRGIRKAKDKDYVSVYDITSSHKYSKRHLTKRKKFYKDQQFRHTVTKVKYK